MNSADEMRERELLYLLAENSSDVVWTMSVTGEITYVSPAVERVRGITREEATRQPLEEILTPESAAVSLAYFQELHSALAEGREPPGNFRGELEYYCADGSTVWTEVQAIPRFGPNGEVLEILGVSRDISERRAQEAAIRQAHIEAEHARAITAERERLARDLHDDLLQTLNGAGLHLSRAEMRAAESADAREPLGKLRDDLQGAMDSVRRLVTGMRTHYLDGRTLREALALLAGDFSARTGIPVAVDLAVDPGPLGDPTEEAVIRVVQEALANIAHHAGASRVDLILRDEDGALVLDVRDDGRGIPVDAVLREDAFGIRGMRERVADIGGTLVVESASGGGTHVTMRVPPARDQSDEAPRDSK